MIIVTTLYNCENYIEQCLASIMGQTHRDFKCYITDDLSTDNSVDLVKKMIEGDDRFVLIQNTVKLYQPGNYDQVIRNNLDISDDEIIVEIDGDDWLPTSKVLEKIYQIYQDTNVWITNGSFRYSNGSNGFSSKQNLSVDLRKSRMTCSHMRTWRAFLWRKIKQEDLKDENGEYWKVTGDLAFMFPMLEMSGEEHYKFVEEIMYVYNEQNPINDHKVDLNLVNEIANKIRNKTKYEKIYSVGTQIQ
jgi:glycosyltransferase involved in cell wall biosynthesis